MNVAPFDDGTSFALTQVAQRPGRSITLTAGAESFETQKKVDQKSDS